MNKSFQKFAFWSGLGLFIFSVFRWLFGLALPDVAFEFASGITFIILGGFLSGWYISRIWFRLDNYGQNILLTVLTLFIIIGLVSLGLLMNRMIGDTQFLHFFFAVLTLFCVNIFTGAIINLIRNRIKTNIQSVRSALAQSKSELQLLQSQLSPHFLFNTLNNLYGLSISDHKKVPNLLLKLAELLRYSVYDAKEIFVPFKDELDYLKNYIDFEKIRLGDRLDLKMSLEQEADTSFKIAPMLLVVFVENAFKHSKNSQDKKILIDIALETEQNTIQFSIVNSHNQAKISSKLKDKHAGFGLASVRKRLNLLYKNAHDLKIKESEKLYTVHLKLTKK